MQAKLSSIPIQILAMLKLMFTNTNVEKFTIFVIVAQVVNAPAEFSNVPLWLALVASIDKDNNSTKSYQLFVIFVFSFH